MLIPGIQSRGNNELYDHSKFETNPTSLTIAIDNIAPQKCMLFHGTKISVLKSMLDSKTHTGALRPYGYLINSNQEVKTGEASRQGHIVNEANIFSVSTCRSENIAIPLKYAFEPEENTENYAVLFGINIDPRSERVSEKHYTDIGFFTDCAVQGNIKHHEISMIMVPECDIDKVRKMVFNTVLQHVQISAFEELFNAAPGWDMVSNSSYSALRDLAFLQQESEHIMLNNFFHGNLPS